MHIFASRLHGLENALYNRSWCVVQVWTLSSVGIVFLNTKVAEPVNKGVNVTVDVTNRMSLAADKHIYLDHEHIEIIIQVKMALTVRLFTH